MKNPKAAKARQDPDAHVCPKCGDTEDDCECHFEGTEGQDRENYSDDQDRESYT